MEKTLQEQIILPRNKKNIIKNINSNSCHASVVKHTKLLKKSQQHPATATTAKKSFTIETRQKLNKTKKRMNLFFFSGAHKSLK